MYVFIKCQNTTLNMYIYTHIIYHNIFLFANGVACHKENGKLPATLYGNLSAIATRDRYNCFYTSKQLTWNSKTQNGDLEDEFFKGGVIFRF